MEIDAQELSFILSCIFFFVCIGKTVLARKDMKWIYMFISLSFAAEFLFYYFVLFTDWGLGHIWSSRLRVFRDVNFGGCMLITLCEDMYNRGWHRNFFETLKKFAGKIKHSCKNLIKKVSSWKNLKLP